MTASRSSPGNVGGESQLPPLGMMPSSIFLRSAYGRAVSGRPSSWSTSNAR